MQRGSETPELPLSMKTSLHAVTESTGSDEFPKHNPTKSAPARGQGAEKRNPLDTYDGALEGSTVVPEMSSAARGASDSS